MEKPKNFVKLQWEELNITEITELVTFPNCGAISHFIGITRDNFEDKKVVTLEYETYESMALKEMQNICAKIRLQWNVEGIAIYHRLGRVPVSKASVVIAISSPHREESLRAVEYAINTLKAKVPIWKKEIYETEEPQWKENKECTWANKREDIPRISKVNEESETSNETDDIDPNPVQIRASTPKSFAKILEREDVPGTAKVNEESETSNETDDIDPDLVQIRASPQEVNRRIQSFIERKRQQVNAENVLEFCSNSETNKEYSCARVDAVLVRHKDSKSHVKVHRVSHTWGPQTVDHSILRKTSTRNKSPDIFAGCSSVLNERISAAERSIGIDKPVPKDVYERLKNIEDRIMFLESVSPEYLVIDRTEDGINSDKIPNADRAIRKRTYSLAEITSKLYKLQNKYPERIHTYK